MTALQITVAQWAGIALGALLIVSVAWVWLQKQIFGMNGAGIGLIGVVLVGLTLWSSISVSYSDEGFEFELTRLQERIDQAETELQQATEQLTAVRSTNADLSARLSELSAVTVSQNTRFAVLANQLQREGIQLDPSVLQQTQRDITQIERLNRQR